MRSLPREESRLLRPGDDHYTAYVGPPDQYDFMGATQFRLLTTLGLREHHRVLDLGCGSLRAGRLLVPYLQPDRYCGVDPNQWLVDEALAKELGNDVVDIKRPRFDDNSDFRGDMFDETFDFVIAQSIFSHATPGLVASALTNIRSVLANRGLFVGTFIERPDTGNAASTPEGWVYPDCVTYTPQEVTDLFTAARLHHVRLPWFHPRQTWHLAAIDPGQLPSEAEMRFLTGAVLRDPEFVASRELPAAVVGPAKKS